MAVEYNKICMRCIVSVVRRGRHRMLEVFSEEESFIRPNLHFPQEQC
jgi:hypothetical protein